MDLQEALVAEFGTLPVAIGVVDLADGREAYLLPDEPFHAASTMKICVLLELFRAGCLDERLSVRNSFLSVVDGSPYEIEAKDDSEKSLYERMGETLTAIELAGPMITHSSNLATNLLVERLGADAISLLMAELGAPGLVVLRGVEDGKAFRAGLNNEVTARGLTQVMKLLAQGRVVSAEASGSMIEILTRQTHRNGIPAGLPDSVTVANKTGWNSLVCHDTGVVFVPGRAPYVLTVLTRGLQECATGQDTIAAVSRWVYGRLGAAC